MSAPLCLFSRGLALGARDRCSLVWWTWPLVMRMRLQRSWNASCCPGFLDRDWWAKRVATFAVDGASNLGVRGASARQVVDVSITEGNVFALIGKWLVLMTPLGGPCNMLQRKLGLALEAAGPTHVDYMAAVDRQRGLYNEARQWKELQKCVQKHVQDKRSGLQLILTSHFIRW